MKVLFDDQIFTLQEYGGISRYFYELIKRGVKENDLEVNVSLKLSNNAYLNKNTYPGLHSFYPHKNIKGKFHFIKWVNQTVSNRAVKRGKYDVFHPTYYDTAFLKHLPAGKPFTVTFLDMIHEKLSHKDEQLAIDKTIYNNKKLLLERASKVIAISESTKNDIIEIFGVEKDRIEVIYLGSSFSAGVATDKRIIDAPYVLFVGNRAGYKNFQFFLKAVVPVLTDNKELKVVCAGGRSFNADEMALIEELKLSDRVIYKDIEDKTLANFYKYAEAFVFPSLYEGFGIPILEAFACGCPCLLSNTSSLPEVGGDAALYFDPLDADSLRTSLSAVLNSKEVRDNLVEKGFKRQQLFSWDKTYTQTIEFYKSLL
jgi:glycosyltransferase involved in cell wall biosynthesis